MRGRRRRRKEGGSTCLIIMELFWAALSFRWSQTLVFLYVCDTVGWSSLTHRHRNNLHSLKHQLRFKSFLIWTVEPSQRALKSTRKEEEEEEYDPPPPSSDEVLFVPSGSSVTVRHSRAGGTSAACRAEWDIAVPVALLSVFAAQTHEQIRRLWLK